jgi:hypothetical protein
MRTRAGYGARALNENLAPLRRYLRSQVGRPWSKVFSEISANIDRRSTVQQHIYQHIDDFIAIQVERRDGRLVDLKPGWRPVAANEGLLQELYVDPRTGLIRVNKDYQHWNAQRTERRKREQADLDKRRRVIDEHTLLLLLEGIWYRVGLEALPTEPQYDVVLRRKVSHAEPDDDRKHLYGCARLYAVSKRQLSKRELRAMYEV